MNGWQIELWSDGEEFGMSTGSTLRGAFFDPKEALEKVQSLKAEGHKNIGIVYASGWDANTISDRDAEDILNEWINDPRGYTVP